MAVGLVRELARFPGFGICADGTIIGKRGRPLVPFPNIDGYPAVRLAGISAGFPVHRLVCEAFHGPKPTPKHEVAHWDGDKTNNTAPNLRWATHKENCQDTV